jgi:transcriptional regulator with XRE-family HTH domain
VTGYQTAAQRNQTCAVCIRERRRQLGLTQGEVVDRVNGYGSRLSSQALSAIENGRRLPVGRLPDLAAALECTVSYLLGLTADPGRWEPDDARDRVHPLLRSLLLLGEGPDPGDEQIDAHPVVKLGVAVGHVRGGFDQIWVLGRGQHREEDLVAPVFLGAFLPE